MNTTDQQGMWRRGAAAARRRIERVRASQSKRRPLQCREVVELVTAYLDGALDDDMRVRFERHLQRCDGCANYLEQLRVTVHTVGAIRSEQLDPVFRARLLDAFAETAGSW